MSNISKLYIFDTRIDNLSKKEIINRINYFLESNAFHQVVTVNPEFLLEAHKNNKFCNILNNSDLNVADGIGVKFAFWRYGSHLKLRYSGIDLMWDILEIANIKKLKIYLVTNAQGLSTWQETRDAILKIYPNLEINGCNIDYQSKFIGDIASSNIIFANFGAPHQEMFISNINKTTQVALRLGMGVGGSFDYITNKIKRAPKFMRCIGLEWLYRLIKQPKRINRIWNAIIIFPIIILCTKSSGQRRK